MKPENERERQRIATALFLASVLAAGAWAQQIPPLPVNDRDFPKALIPVVEAEHAFAVTSAAKGMKEAFLSFAAPEGVIFRRAPVNAIEAWTQTNPAPTGLLTWWPVYADVSSAGDLGYTTGPYEFREKPDDREPSAAGHFFTVWQKQPDGTWKFVLDFGIRHAAPASAETALQYPAALRKNPGGAKADTAAARNSLAAAEQSLADESASKGAAPALLAHADETLRLYRQNSFPVVGREAVRSALEGKTGVVTWKQSKTFVANSGDLGYAYGTYELRSKPADEKPAEQGNYVRMWKRRGGAWRVVLDVTNPVRPQ
jgi:ketosteroid isomerase-like protein